jgi:VCBS repeat-containing protein
MNRTQSVSRLVLALAAGAAVLSVPGPAFAVTYYLKATTFTLADPNGGTGIPMWGYALCQDSLFTNCAPSATAPGPALTVPANDTELKISLSNDLTVPTSLVINGLIKPMTPVWDGGETGNRPSATARVRSFDAEASAGGGTVDYTWSNVKPGTYLYQSGTQPQVQVQMGLYGAMTKNQTEAVTGTPALAYTGVPYDNQATLLYSEIDPALHAAVDTGTYGTTPGLTSTFNYAPKYFLINGQPYPNANSVVSPVGNTGRTLLRLLNAGLTTHVPMLQGNFWTPVAEDGKPYAYPTSQYTALLPAAKTMDVVLVADAGGAVYPVIDRRLNLSNNGLSNGGMLTQLVYGAAGIPGGGPSNGNNALPVATSDVYNSVKGVTLSVGAVEGVLSNDSDSDNLPLPIRAVAATGATANGGTYTLNANGAFVYTPSATGTATTDSFTYSVTDGLALSNVATVTINLTTPTAPASLATLDNFDRANAINLGTSWAQAANTGSGSDLQVSGNAARAVNGDLGGLAIWASGLPLGATQGAQFVLGASHLNSALVLKATGGSASAPANYVRVRYESNNNVDEIVVSTMVGGNNISVFVKQAAFPVSLGTNDVLTAVVDAKGLVTVFKGTAFVGGVQLPDVGAWKGTGRVGIQLQSVGATIDSFMGGTL